MVSLRNHQSEMDLQRRKQIVVRSIVSLGLCGLLLITQPGCLGLFANLVNATGASRIKPVCSELEKSRVVVVALTEESIYRDDVSARILGRNVRQWLGTEVKDIELVREDKIADWRDRNGWDTMDFVAMGRELEADKVLIVQVGDLSLRDGATLYRGNANVVTTVYNTETGNEVFQSEIEEFRYPQNSGVYTNETTETRFRKLYLGILAKRVSRQFYPYDRNDDFALDAITSR
ncbi:hypothetical protein SV7mr_08680 [Stieleria bergensis]|uniref:Uncharacterized protein n=1 Tax=Stieleria bergensis TaxID=2528025 RepID=A0A517SQI0_9BACT|nr:hypothetical protein SV7mr_08680 [Planctomycetes bacterium SV_7m_r]